MVCSFATPLPALAGTAAQSTQPLDLFDLGAPSFTTFSTRDGLRGPVTVTLRTDRQGIVWAGTPHGLAWYDGKRWHPLDNPALGGYIKQLFVDDTGTLWACGSSFGLARYDGKHWHIEGVVDGLTSEDVRRLVETNCQGAKRLWASLLFAIVAIAVIYALMRWRTPALRRRQHALEQRIDARTAELNRANRQLLEFSRRDALTGVFNRHWLMESLQLGTHAEHRSVMASLIFIDVDHFKQFNDSLGHLAGDEALRIVAQAIGECAPADAVVARYGGEEFACLLFNIELPAAHAIAERIRVEVEQRAVQAPGKDPRHVTISAGVACSLLGSEDAAEQLLREADEAQYAAKRAGRNCVRDTIREP